MKKLILINFLISLLVCTAFLTAEYSNSYPTEFNIGKLFKQILLAPFIILFTVAIIFSLPFSFLRMKRLNFKEKYLRGFPVMNLLLIILIIRISYPVYAETKERIEEGEQRNIIQAKKDISNDLIIFEVPGGVSDSYNEKLNQQIDSITKKYEVLYKNTGCVVDNAEIEILKKYTALTERY